MPVGLGKNVAKIFKSFAVLVLLVKSVWLPLATSFDGGRSHLGVTGHIEVDALFNFFVITIAGICLTIGNKIDRSWRAPTIICATLAVVLIIQTLAIYVKWRYVIS